MTLWSSGPRRLAIAAGIAGAVGVIYRPVASSYFFNDDFQWLWQATKFQPANVLHLERYDHFYRPVIEMYFYLGQRLFGCNAYAFHLASIGIHLVNTLLLSMFAGALSGSLAFAAFAAVFFAVQPSFVEAVAWVGAITDLLPALWYILTLWLFLLFLQRRGLRYYVAALATFFACLLTHESSATLLPMMIVVEATLAFEHSVPAAGPSLGRRLTRYVPFTFLLAGYLAIAYVVNRRSYLIREGHYQLGLHAIPHTLQYIVSLYVGKQTLASFVVVVAGLVALLTLGTPRVRFSVLWILVTIAPASFFTWGNASRYLYLPAAGFALLLADMMLRLQTASLSRVPPRAVSTVTLLVTGALALRFGVFAAKGAADFPARTETYRRYVAAIRSSMPMPPADGVVSIDRDQSRDVPALYQDVAARVAYCMADVHVVER